MSSETITHDEHLAERLAEIAAMLVVPDAVRRDAARLAMQGHSEVGRAVVVMDAARRAVEGLGREVGEQ